MRPVFIVGCPRSGTTLVRRMLNNHPNLSSGPETHFLSSLLDIERTRWNQIALYGITQAEWHSHIRDLFSWLHTQRAEREGKARWVDKTPGYALILDFINELYPDCQVIHVLRDPHDVIDSWRRRVGPVKARQSVKAWPRHVRAARAFRDSHPAERFTEIRYEELVADSKTVMTLLLEWLGEPWDPNVLQLKATDSEGRVAESHQELWKLWIGESESSTGSASSPQWKPVASRNSTEVFSNSVGAGTRGTNRLINAPYFLELDLTSRDLVHELGYSRSPSR